MIDSMWLYVEWLVILVWLLELYDWGLFDE